MVVAFYTMILHSPDRINLMAASNWSVDLLNFQGPNGPSKLPSRKSHKQLKEVKTKSSKIHAILSVCSHLHCTKYCIYLSLLHVCALIYY